MSKQTTPRCSACRFWMRQRGATSKLGDCDGALEHARSVVAFAVDITKSATFAHGGRDCPRFQPNAVICGSVSDPRNDKTRSSNTMPTAGLDTATGAA